MGKEMILLSIRPYGTSRVLLHAVKSYDMGVLRIYIALKKSIVLAGFEPATFGSSGKHTNHYTTKATLLTLLGIRDQRDTGYGLLFSRFSVQGCY
jgi:hypothetical protein